MYEAYGMQVRRYITTDGAVLAPVSWEEVKGRPCWTAGRGAELTSGLHSKRLYVHRGPETGSDCWVMILPPPRTEAPKAPSVLTTDKALRKEMPIARGVVDYFPLALAEVARVSFKGNQQHNPGEEMHWAREKSTDHADCIGRHLIERGRLDDDGMRHSAKLAWRALALLQLELEDAAKEQTRG